MGHIPVMCLSQCYSDELHMLRLPAQERVIHQPRLSPALANQHPSHAPFLCASMYLDTAQINSPKPTFRSNTGSTPRNRPPRPPDAPTAFPPPSPRSPPCAPCPRPSPCPPLPPPPPPLRFLDVELCAPAPPFVLVVPAAAVRLPPSTCTGTPSRGSRPDMMPTVTPTVRQGDAENSSLGDASGRSRELHDNRHSMSGA